MKNFFNPGNLRKITITLVVIGLVTLAISGYLTPLFNLSLSPLISSQSWLSLRYLSFKEFFTLPRDAATLREQNIQLENQVSQLESEIIQLEENLSESQILYALLDFARTNPQHEYVAATVIGREISPFLQYVIIDKGSNQGIQHGMPVVTQQGLVGKVDAVIANAARIQLITDAGSTVNVRLQTAKVEAQIKGSVTGDITLEMLPQDVNIEPGDVVLTSGLGGNFPPNIFIGQVISVRQVENALFKTGSVQAIVDYSSMNAVLVITNFQAVDISPLIP
jgi:rod shape-determining protein MreC